MNSGNVLHKCWRGLEPVLLQLILSMLVTVVALRFGRDPLKITLAADLLSAAAMGMIYRSDRKCSSVWEGGHRPRLYWYAVIVLFGVCCCLVLNGLLNLSGLTRLLAEDYEAMSRVLYESSSLWLSAVTVVIAAPAAEELVFRGLCYRRLRDGFTFVPAALLSALCFGIYHGNPAQGIYGFLLGLLLAWSYERFRSLAAPVLLHMSANAFSLLLTKIPELNQFLCGSLPRLVFSVLIFTLIGSGCFCLVQVRMYSEEKRSEIIDDCRPVL